jgi:hypothetical protein
MSQLSARDILQNHKYDKKQLQARKPRMMQCIADLGQVVQMERAGELKPHKALSQQPVFADWLQTRALLPEPQSDSDSDSETGNGSSSSSSSSSDSGSDSSSGSDSDFD